jgi:trehalose 6-phosphate synthase
MPRPQDLNARPVWNAERLRRWVTTRYAGESMVVLANRAPFRHDRAPDGGIVLKRAGGGLVTALEPLVRPAQECGWHTAREPPIGPLSIGVTG